MAFLKVESKGSKYFVLYLLLHVISTLIKAVENVCFAKIDFGETHHLNGSNQSILSFTVTTRVTRTDSNYLQLSESPSVVPVPIRGAEQSSLP